MIDEPNPYAAPSAPIEAKPSARPEPGLIGDFVYLVGWSWPFLLAIGGVASDRVRIPISTKVALSVASLLLPLLLTRFGGRYRWG